MDIKRIFNANVKVWQMAAALVITSFALTGLATAGSTSAPPTITISSHVITACAHKKNGQLRVLWSMTGAMKTANKTKQTPRSSRCNKNERIVQWGTVGPVGPAGPTGATGAAGETGATGATGPVSGPT